MIAFENLGLVKNSSSSFNPQLYQPQLHCGDDNDCMIAGLRTLPVCPSCPWLHAHLALREFSCNNEIAFHCDGAAGGL